MEEGERMTFYFQVDFMIDFGADYDFICDKVKSIIKSEPKTS